MPIPTVRAFFLTVPCLLAVVGAQGDAPTDAAADAPIVVKGKCYELHFHGGDERLAALALAAVEPVWPLVAKAVGQPDAPPKQLLEVHLYRTIAGYEAAELRLTKGKFARNLAMIHHASESVHVALQPPCSDETLRAIGLPGLTLELLAWEATHLARRSLLGTQGDHPMWLVDGLAARTARTVARQLLAPPRDGEPEGTLPTGDTDVALVQELAKAKKLPPASAILADRIDELDMHDRYATRALFFELLSAERHAPALAKVLGTVRSTGGGKNYLEKVLATAKTTFGKRLDAEFPKYVAERSAPWFETFRSLAPFEGGWQQVAFPDTNAIAWHRQPVAGGAVRIAGKLRILPGSGRQLNVLFGRTADEGFYSVAFVADHGFTPFAFRAKNDEWVRVGDGNAPSLRRGYTSSFVVEVRGDALHVELDGQQWDFSLPEKLPKDVFWGLGAQAGGKGAETGTAGLWGDVTATAPK